MMSRKFRKNLALALGVCMISSASLVTPVIAAPTTTSTQQSTAKNVSSWAESTVKQFMGADYNTSYNYKFKATREEFAEVLERALTNTGYQFSEPSGNPFSDTTNKSVIKLAQAGLLAGTAPGKYSPKDTLTREQMAVILCRVYDKLGVKMPKTVSYNISDANKISPYAKESVERCYRANIIVGDGNVYNPKAIVSREQAIVISARTEETIKTYKKDQESKPTTPPPGTGNQVTENALYTYDATAKTIVIKKDCILDVSKSGTPKDFTKVTVNSGVEATFKGIKIKDMVCNSNSLVKLQSSTVESVAIKDADIQADKASTIKALSTYGSVSIDADDTEITKVVIYEGDDDDEVVVQAKAKEVSVEAPVELELDGQIGDVNVKKDDCYITIIDEAEDVTVTADDCKIYLKSKAKVDKVIMDGESYLEVASGAKLKKLEIKEDGEDCEIKLKHSSSTDIKIDADCKINSKKIKEDDKVEYKSGSLVIDGKNQGGSSSDDDDDDANDDAVDEAYDYLTYDYILGSNKDKNAIVGNLVLSSSVRGCSVQWFSNNEAVVSTSGTVNRIASDTPVELRAKITKGDSSTSKTFNVIVKAKEDTGTPETPEEALKKKLDADLGLISFDSTLASPINLAKKSQNQYDLTYATNSGNAVIKDNGSSYTLTPTQTTSDQSFVLTVTIKSGNVTSSKTINMTIPKKDAPVVPEVPDVEILKTDMKAQIDNHVSASVPSTMVSGDSVEFSKLVTTTLPDTRPYGITVTSANTGVIEINDKGSAPTITAKDVTVPTQVVLTITSNYDLSAPGDKWEGTGNATYTTTKTVTVNPKSTNPPETVTKEKVEQDMLEKLNGLSIPNSIKTTTEVDRTVKGKFAEADTYTVNITPVSPKFLTVAYSGDKLELIPDNQLITGSWTVPTTVTLTTNFNGEAMTVTKEHPITVVELHDEDYWKNKLQDEMRKQKDSLVARIPKALTTTSSAIQTLFTMDIDGVDFFGMIEVEIPESETRITVNYLPNNEITLTPNVVDGSQVPVKVNVCTQIGGTIMRLPTEIQITLGNLPPVNPPTDEIWADMTVSAEIFEIINSIDILMESTGDPGNFTVIVKDKHLATELGRTEVSGLTHGATGFANTVEVITYKNAILGEYTYELVKDGSVVKQGDLVKKVTKSPNTQLSFKEK